jgi:hypothetical protein
LIGNHFLNNHFPFMSDFDTGFCARPVRAVLASPGKEFMDWIVMRKEKPGKELSGLL